MFLMIFNGVTVARGWKRLACYQKVSALCQAHTEYQLLVGGCGYTECEHVLQYE